MTAEPRLETTSGAMLFIALGLGAVSFMFMDASNSPCASVAGKTKRACRKLSMLLPISIAKFN